jgi:hypothetical protein
MQLEILNQFCARLATKVVGAHDPEIPAANRSTRSLPDAGRPHQPPTPSSTIDRWVPWPSPAPPGIALDLQIGSHLPVVPLPPRRTRLAAEKVCLPFRSGGEESHHDGDRKGENSAKKPPRPSAP